MALERPQVQKPPEPKAEDEGDVAGGVSTPFGKRLRMRLPNQKPVKETAASKASTNSEASPFPVKLR